MFCQKCLFIVPKQDWQNLLKLCSGKSLLGNDCETMATKLQISSKYCNKDPS